MKYLFFVAFFLQSFVAVSQTKKPDYKIVMGKFMKFYNNKQGDSIVYLFNPNQRCFEKNRWTPQIIYSLHEQYGKIKSYKYLNKRSNNEGAMAFETIFTKIGINGTSMELNKENYVVDFELIMYPNTINKPKKAK